MCKVRLVPIPARWRKQMIPTQHVDRCGIDACVRSTVLGQLHGLCGYREQCLFACLRRADTGPPIAPHNPAPHQIKAFPLTQ
ncbi:hypothetical protein SFUMM280S_06519 [Streptomyces fumanus]